MPTPSPPPQAAVPRPLTAAKGQHAVVLCLVLLLLTLFVAAGVRGVAPDAVHEGALAAMPLARPDVLLGTDDLGRDLIARLAQGCTISLGMGLGGCALSLLVGTIVGLTGGLLHRSEPGKLIQQGLLLLDGLPGLLVLMLGSVLIEGAAQTSTLGGAQAEWVRFAGLLALVGLLNATDVARAVLTTTTRLMASEGWEAFVSLGGPPIRFAARYVLPQCVPILRALGLLIIARCVVAESTLSFVGLGLQPPLSSLGVLASEGWHLIRICPWILLEACLTLGLVLTLCQLAASGLSRQST